MSVQVPRPEQSESGKILQAAREKRRLSKRRAAELAQISEGRWRQLEMGWKLVDREWVPTTAPASRYYMAALAVNADPTEVLVAAGFPPDMTSHLGIRGHVIEMIHELSEPQLIRVEGFIEGMLAQ